MPPADGVVPACAPEQACAQCNCPTSRWPGNPARMEAPLTPAPLFLTRRSVVVAVHPDTWAVGKKEARFVAGAHLRAVLASIAGELCMRRIGCACRNRGHARHGSQWRGRCGCGGCGVCNGSPLHLGRIQLRDRGLLPALRHGAWRLLVGRDAADHTLVHRPGLCRAVRERKGQNGAGKQALNPHVIPQSKVRAAQSRADGLNAMGVKTHTSLFHTTHCPLLLGTGQNGIVQLLKRHRHHSQCRSVDQTSMSCRRKGPTHESRSSSLHKRKSRRVGPTKI